MHGGFSGGTVSTTMTFLEQVPPEKKRENNVDFNLSPGELVVPSLGTLVVISFLFKCSSRPISTSLPILLQSLYST